MSIHSELLWLSLPFHSFHREEERRSIVCPSQQGEEEKKLFLNFQRTQITQRKQKQRWSEIILELNIRFFF